MSRTLSHFIADDLRAHSPAEGEDLTLANLAQKYGVSLTPVRHAVNALLVEGVLERSENGRLKRVGSGMSAPSPALPRRWEDDLRQEVLARSLRGENDFLREEALAESLGIGRTALRQVLSRLAGQGFLIHEARRGWRVRPVTLDAVEEYLAVREKLELLALDLALPNLDPAKLRALREGNTLDQIDNGLHALIISAAGNRYISEFFERQGAYFAALFDWATPKTNRAQEMATQHREILDYLLKGDITKSKIALSTHIQSQRNILLELITQFKSA